MNDRHGIPKAVVIGVGPSRGLGAAVARSFATAGHHVIVAGRTEAALAVVQKEIEAAGGRATAVATDATDEGSVHDLFATVEDLPGETTAAIYNVGNNRPGRIVEMETSYFENSFRSGCLGGFLFGREAVRRWLAHPGEHARTLIFTGASASLRGRAGFGAFAAAKGALRQLAQAMAREYGPEGIHVAHVVVDGGIAGDKIIEGVPAFAEAVGEDGLVDLQGLADAYLYLHRQPRQAWTFELDVRTFKERW